MWSCKQMLHTTLQKWDTILSQKKLRSVKCICNYLDCTLRRTVVFLDTLFHFVDGLQGVGVDKPYYCEKGQWFLEVLFRIVGTLHDAAVDKPCACKRERWLLELLYHIVVGAGRRESPCPEGMMDTNYRLNSSIHLYTSSKCWPSTTVHYSHTLFPFPNVMLGVSKE